MKTSAKYFFDYFIKNNMKNLPKIAVLGGGGRTGQFVVRQLLEQGFQIKLLLRNPENFKIENPLIEIIKGDAIHFEDIFKLLEGTDAIISTVGQRPNEPLVASQATANILQAMAQLEIRRYILLAGINVNTPSDEKGQSTLMATEYMKANFPIIHEDRQKGYKILEESDADWTLVRVPFIEFTELTSSTEVDLKDCKGTKISAVDIAIFMVNQLCDKKFSRKAPFIWNP